MRVLVAGVLLFSMVFLGLKTFAIAGCFDSEQNGLMTTIHVCPSAAAREKAAFFGFVRGGNRDEVETFLATHPQFNIDEKDGGETGLHIAAAADNLGVVNVLLKYGAETTIVDDANHRTALAIAQRADHTVIVNRLRLGQRAGKWTAVDLNQQTPVVPVHDASQGKYAR